MILGTDIGHVEAFLHGFPMPTVVTGRAHVTSVHAWALIVVRSYRLAFGQVGIGQEFVGAAFTFYQFFRCKFPGHPIRYLVFAVVGGGIALAVQYLFGYVFSGAGSRGFPVVSVVSARFAVFSVGTGSLLRSALAIGSWKTAARHARTIR